MSFVKSDFENLDSQLYKITSQKVEEITISNNVPTVESLKNTNLVNVIDATILFIDIRKSTELTDESKPKTMVKIYRSFMRMAVECVRKNNGVTRQFIGDRIMAVFYDIIDEDGNIMIKSVDSAVNCARTLQTCISFSLNKRLKENVAGKMISCGIGIDSGKILVSKVGMYGLETNDDKENETDCVWISKVTNYASKYADISEGNEIFISEKVYENMSEYLQNYSNWNKVIRKKGNNKYFGYCTKDFYLDFANEFDNEYKLENNNLTDSESELASIIDKLNEKYNELKIKEVKLTEKENTINTDSINLKNFLDEIYDSYFIIIRELFLQDELLKKMGFENVSKILNSLYDVGKLKGKSRDEINELILPNLVDIYNTFSSYADSYKYMMKMIKTSDWVIIRKETIKWSYENHESDTLKRELDKRIEGSLSTNEQNDWKRYKNEVIKILEEK